ncbi:MAG: hypothetical protein NZ954_08840 [Thermofilaceae archaeon]|nr:hypothetical protein [Thermofilaceae archaeon]
MPQRYCCLLHPVLSPFYAVPEHGQQDPHRQDRDRYVTFNSFPVAVGKGEEGTG